MANSLLQLDISFSESMIAPYCCNIACCEEFFQILSIFIVTFDMVKHFAINNSIHPSCIKYIKEVSSKCLS